MRTGTATIDITPEVGCELSGYVARVQPSVAIHDPLAVHALYLEQARAGKDAGAPGAGTRLLWLHTDLIGFEREFVQEVKEELHRRLDLALDQIVVSATHTHSGPATVHLNHCGAYDAAYIEWLRPRLVEAASLAAAETREAHLVAAEGHCGLAIDRRGQASAHTDHRIGVLAWQRTDGAYAAVLANYAMHNVGLGSENRHVSSDIFGAAAASVRARLPGQPVVLFSNGACGNTNPPEHATDFARIDAWGASLADGVLQALAEAAPQQDHVEAVAETVRVPLDTGGSGAITAWTEALRSEMDGKGGYVPDRILQAAEFWEEEMLRREQEGSLPAHAPMDVQVIRLGGVFLVCLGAEVFSVMADQLRGATGQALYVVGYANGDIGYLAAAAAYAEGGYEVSNAFIFYNSFRPRIGAFEMVRDKAVELVSAMERKHPE